MQGQRKSNAIELARIAEVQPVLADFIGKIRNKKNTTQAVNLRRA